MKRILAILLLLSLIGILPALAACGAPETGPSEAQTEAETPDSSRDAESGSVTETEPETGAPSGPDYDFVALIGVDGSGNAFKDVDSPNYDRICADGNVKLDAQAVTPTNSAENWTSMLHGVLPSRHRRNNTNTGQERYPADSPYPSIFKLLHEQRPEAVLASFNNWGNINYGVIEEDIGVYKLNVGSDEQLTKEICSYVKRSKPTLMFVQFDEVDHTGHADGYMTESYLNQLEKTDVLLGEIYDAYEEAGILDRTLFIVAADHGGIGKSHGGLSNEELTVAFAVAGHTVLQGGAIGEMDQRDIAAVIAYALNVETPDTWTARVPSGIFPGVGGEERPADSTTALRTHASEPTPDFNGDRSVTKFVSADLIAYLPFDGDVDDACGNETAQTGALEWGDGFYGDAVDMQKNGYVTLSGFRPGTDSFTVSMWFKTEGVQVDPCLCSNKNWASGLNPGFVLALRESDVKFNAGTGSARTDLTCNLPEDFRNGWVHVTMVVDRDANQVLVYYDFSDPYVLTMPDAFSEATFNAYDGLNIGQDGTGSLNCTLGHTLIDEFMLFDGALSAEEVRALAAYYGI